MARLSILVAVSFIALSSSAQAAHCPHGQYYRVHRHECVAKSSLARHSVNRIKPKPVEDVMHGDDGRTPLHDEVVYPKYPKDTSTPRDGTEGSFELKTLPDAFRRSIMTAPPMKWILQ
jgi:hypothetical protein